jgi:organic hydroperoxide reductase OsmC/OhrA
VTLRPEIVWTGAKMPTPADLDRLHHRAHEECFIANSVKTAIHVNPPAA